MIPAFATHIGKMPYNKEIFDASVTEIKKLFTDLNN